MASTIKTIKRIAPAAIMRMLLTLLAALLDEELDDEGLDDGVSDDEGGGDEGAGVKGAGAAGAGETGGGLPTLPPPGGGTLPPGPEPGLMAGWPPLPLKGLSPPLPTPLINFVPQNGQLAGAKAPLEISLPQLPHVQTVSILGIWTPGLLGGLKPPPGG